MKTSPSELLRTGGSFLKAARNWLQWNAKNGSDVTWNSNDVISPPLTVKQVEDLAAHVAAAVYDEIKQKEINKKD